MEEQKVNAFGLKATPSSDEIWKPLPEKGFEDLYEVSNLGRVRNITTGYISHARPRVSATGYVTLPISVYDRSSKQRDFSVNVLVAKAFLGECPNGYKVRFRDDNRINVRADNLYYSPVYRNTHLAKKAKGEDSHMQILAREIPCMIMTPAQFADWTQRKILTGPEKLLSALFEGVCKDLENNYRMAHPQAQMLYEDAWQWIKSESEEPYSFVYFCLVFGLEPRWVRAKIRAWVENKRWGEDPPARERQAA